MGLLRRMPVRLEERSYDVLIGVGHLRSLGREIRRRDLGTHAVVVSNGTVLRRHGRALTAALRRGGFPVRLLTVADSERSKSLSTLSTLLLRLAQGDGPGRRQFLVLAGGGVVGDLGGVAAGLYRRGIPYVQVPTTLLSQVDSAIGGKTGVDLPQGKNLVGLIHQPQLVFIELRFLRTLSGRQFRSGLAEVLKCAVIRDRALFAFLEGTAPEQLRQDERGLAWVVARAVAVKASVVAADERETKGLRTILNFGHTLGHAVEAASGYRRTYTHGEAVAVGMCAATEISRRLGRISRQEAERVRGLIGRFGLPTVLRATPLQPVLAAMAHDKKWARGRNRWVLPAGIGRCVVLDRVPERVVRDSIRSVMEG